MWVLIERLHRKPTMNIVSVFLNEEDLKVKVTQQFKFALVQHGFLRSEKIRFLTGWYQNQMLQSLMCLCYLLIG